MGFGRALTLSVALVLLAGVLRSSEPRILVAEKLTLLGPSGEMLAQSASPTAVSILHCARDTTAALAISCGALAVAFEDCWHTSHFTNKAYRATIASYLAGSICLLQGMKLVSPRESSKAIAVDADLFAAITLWATSCFHLVFKWFSFRTAY